MGCRVLKDGLFKLNGIVDKLRNFWLGTEEEMDDGFDELFRMNSPAAPTDAGVNRLLPVNNKEAKQQGTEQKADSARFKMIGNPLYSATNEVIVLEPANFNQAIDIIQYLKKGSSIVLNLSKLEEDQSQRLLDFVCGGIYALDGSQKRVGEGVFLLAPSSVNINSVAMKKEPKQHQFWSNSKETKEGKDKENE